MIRRWVLSVLILLFMAFGLFVILQYETNSEEQDLYEEAPFDVFLPDYEFSGIVHYEDQIIVGGNEGVFIIDRQLGSVKELLNEGEPFALVRSLEIHDSQLWIGHETGVTVWASGQVHDSINLEDGLLGERVTTIYSGQNVVYIGGFKGVSMIDQTGIRHLTTENGLLELVTKTIYKDSQDRIWFGSYMANSGGVTIMDPREGKFEYLTVEDGLCHHAITTILETDEGVWVGGGSFTEGGATLFSYEKGEWRVVDTRTVDNGMIGGKIRYIFEDDSGNLWFCSENDGVAIKHLNNNFTYMTVDNGLSDNEVKEMIYDDEGNLWLATRRGITKISKSWLDSNRNIIK